MKLTLVVALVAAVLSVIDFFDVAKRGEQALRAFVGWNVRVLGRISIWLVYVGLAAIAIMTVLAYGLIPMQGVGINRELIRLVDDTQYWFFKLGMSLLLLNIVPAVLMLSIWGAFWLLSLPKRGIMSTLGLVVALVAVGLEVAH